MKFITIIIATTLLSETSPLPSSGVKSTLVKWLISYEKSVELQDVMYNARDPFTLATRIET